MLKNNQIDSYILKDIYHHPGYKKRNYSYKKRKYIYKKRKYSYNKMDNNLPKKIAEDEVLATLIEELDKDEEYHDYSYQDCQNEYEEDMNKNLNLRDDEDEVKSRERSGSFITNEDLTYSPVIIEYRKVLKK